MKKLRLEEIIKLVEENSIVADIGTDHGIVPYELVKSAKAKKVIASDISEKSLDKLREKLDYLDEPEKIVLNVSDGLILGANNSLALLRRFLHENSFEIIEEVDLFENDKYYQIIKAKVGKQLFVNEYEYEYGKYLIDNKSEYLKKYINKQIENKNNILSNLSDKNSDSIKSAIENINVEVNELEKVLDKIET